ncbi:MAG: hypothetical protein ABWZ58_04740, partial [Acidimicrobiia bacterium]
MSTMHAMKSLVRLIALLAAMALALPAMAHGDHDARPLLRRAEVGPYTSFLQPFIPRPELHLVYNLIVFIPMIVAMWLHTRPA